MSSILKALKKLEREKVARKYDYLDIDAEILRGDDPPRFPLVKVALMVGLVFLCGSAATYLYMKHAVTPSSTSSNVAVGKPTDFTTTTTPAITDSHSRNATPPVTSPQTGAAVTDRARRHLNTAISPPRQQPHQYSKPVRTNVHTALPMVPVSKDKPSPVTIKQATSPVALPATTAMMPLIKVNGISFQGGETGSVAVVNGAPVTTGSIVDGTRVEDIRKDRVLFSYGDVKFEVGLGKSNR